MNPLFLVSAPPQIAFSSSSFQICLGTLAAVTAARLELYANSTTTMSGSGTNRFHQKDFFKDE